MIAALLRAVFGGVLVAGLVHVVAVLSIPGAAPGDAVHRVEAIAPPSTITILPPGADAIGGLDPHFVHAVCPFDVAAGPVEVSGTMPADVWSVAVAAGSGGIAGSLERGSVADDRLDVVIGRPDDVEKVRLRRAEAGRPVATVEVPSDRGFVLLRAFDGPRAVTDDIAGTLAAISCRRAD